MKPDLLQQAQRAGIRAAQLGHLKILKLSAAFTEKHHACHAFFKGIVVDLSSQHTLNGNADVPAVAGDCQLLPGRVREACRGYGRPWEEIACTFFGVVLLDEFELQPFGGLRRGVVDQDRVIACVVNAKRQSGNG